MISGIEKANSLYLNINSPYCLPHSAYNVSAENLVLNQTI